VNKRGMWIRGAIFVSASVAIAAEAGRLFPPVRLEFLASCCIVVLCSGRSREGGAGCAGSSSVLRGAGKTCRPIQGRGGRSSESWKSRNSPMPDKTLAVADAWPGSLTGARPATGPTKWRRGAVRRGRCCGPGLRCEDIDRGTCGSVALLGGLCLCSTLLPFLCRRGTYRPAGREFSQTRSGRGARALVLPERGGGPRLARVPTVQQKKTFRRDLTRRITGAKGA
jgi:hypothetical protein